MEWGTVAVALILGVIGLLVACMVVLLLHVSMLTQSFKAWREVHDERQTQSDHEIEKLKGAPKPGDMS